MNKQVRSSFKKIVIGLFLLVFSFQFASSRPGPGELEYRFQPNKGLKYEELLNRAFAEGQVNVIVRLRVEGIDELKKSAYKYRTDGGGSSPAGEYVSAKQVLKDEIAAVAGSVLLQLKNTGYKVKHYYSSVPIIALEVSPRALSILHSLPDVLDVKADTIFEVVDPTPSSQTEYPDSSAGEPNISAPLLNTVTDIIDADKAWLKGFTGSGWYVVVIDSGIYSDHNMFVGKKIKEYCFSHASCPDSAGNLTLDFASGEGAAEHVTGSSYHGTMVASTAVGNLQNCGESLRGVAKGADVIAIRVNSCGTSNCLVIYESDFVAALEYVKNLAGVYNIAAVNASLTLPTGTTTYTPSGCAAVDEYGAVRDIISDLDEYYRIPTIIASGNSGSCNAVGFPGCIAEAVTIGNSTDNDQEYSGSNWHKDLVDFFAPGVDVRVATKDLTDPCAIVTVTGTSISAPVMAGAWAILRQWKPGGTVEEFYNAFKNSGPLITSKCGDGSKPRINVNSALAQINPIQVIYPDQIGEIWELGSSKEITWTANNVGTVTIELLRNCQHQCESVGLIVHSTPNDGSFIWTVGDCGSDPVEPGTYYSLEISWDNDPTQRDMCDCFFTIADPTPATVTVTSPNGGEQWEQSSWHDITWNSENLGGNVGIILVKNGADLGNIVGETANDGVYNWEVGQYQAGTAAAAADYRVKVVSIDNGNVVDTSDQDFSITQPSASYITVTQPAAGDIWEKNLAYEIRWTSSADIPAGSNVSVKLMKNGAYVGLIESSIPNSGTYNWTIPADIDGNELFGSGYKIRIKSLSTLVEGYSDSFTIKGIRLTSPNGGESWALDSVHNITWEAPGVTNTVKISLWKDGVKVENVAWVEPSLGAYAWTVGQYVGGTASPGSGYTIKVKEQLTAYADFSDAPFTIADSQPEPVTYTLYPTTVPSVANWIQESYIIGEYDGNKAEGSPTGTTYLVATNFDNWTLPAGKVITKVEYGVLARFTDGVRGKARMREFSHSEAERWLTFGLAWEWTDFDVTALETSWTQSEVDALQVGIRRAYVDDPDANLRVGGIRLKVTVQ